MDTATRIFGGSAPLPLAAEGIARERKG